MTFVAGSREREVGEESRVGRAGGGEEPTNIVGGGGEKQTNVVGGRSQQKRMIHAMSDKAFFFSGWREAMFILGFDVTCEPEHREPGPLQGWKESLLGIRLPRLFLRGAERSKMAGKREDFFFFF